MGKNQKNDILDFQDERIVDEGEEKNIISAYNQVYEGDLVYEDWGYIEDPKFFDFMYY